ncbi:hypothetical protein S7711_10257 [Stachybotrys chartarum IBT 7711]|uniref:Uncharacterized protein n=1 Tax=Stachybotrys chartarum (strain CBS 109288 / IBT 7711) TaxID=1280523 RepID=A0A084AXS7_STACB|nr:hypothetical protein S7711_10257 [Stachybotrys chartarum IBT 7711]
MTWFDGLSQHSHGSDVVADITSTDNSRQAEDYDVVVNRPHEAKWTHELLGGAAAYEAAKAYENHVARNGRPANHAQAKEILAGFIGAFVDREIETKGLDSIDREKAKHHTRRQAEEQLANGEDY